MGKASPLGLGCHTYRHRTSYLPQFYITQPFHRSPWLCLDNCLSCAHPNVENIPSDKAMCPSKERCLIVLSVAALKSYFWWYSDDQKYIHPMAKTVVFLPVPGWVQLLAMGTHVVQSQIRLSIRRVLGTAIAVHAVLHPMGEGKRAAGCNPEELFGQAGVMWLNWSCQCLDWFLCTTEMFACMLQARANECPRLQTSSIHLLFSKWGSVLYLQCRTTN